MRLIVMNGRALQVDGKYAAFRRRNDTGDARSNMHTGGKGVECEVTDKMLELVDMVRPKLVRDGMFLCGLDIVDDKLMEINVFSPGGLGSAQHFMGVDFTAAILDAVEAVLGAADPRTVGMFVAPAPIHGPSDEAPNAPEFVGPDQESLEALLATRDRAHDEIRDFGGLANRRPGVAALMTVFLLSLGGFPPTAGFIAKWYVFSAAIEQGYYTLAVIGVLTSVVSVFFYLRIVVMMYMTEGAETVRPRLPATAVAGLALATIAVFYLGVLPTRVLDLALASISTIF